MQEDTYIFSIQEEVLCSITYGIKNNWVNTNWWNCLCSVLWSLIETLEKELWLYTSGNNVTSSKSQSISLKKEKRKKPSYLSKNSPFASSEGYILIELRTVQHTILLIKFHLHCQCIPPVYAQKHVYIHNWTLSIWQESKGSVRRLSCQMKASLLEDIEKGKQAISFSAKTTSIFGCC